MTRLVEHTQSCPVCGARDDGMGTKFECHRDRRDLGPDLIGVKYSGQSEVGPGHEWQCMECGHSWETIAGHVYELPAMSMIPLA